MKIAYIDCFSGISGDMLLGALVDAGVPLAHIERGLKKLKIHGYALREAKVKRAGIAATKVDVIVGPEGRRQTARRWRDVRRLIEASGLPGDITNRGIQVFRMLFAAEAKVHGKTISASHLHELGCVDCLVDVFGALIGFSLLGIEEVYASAVNVGSGTTRTSHGALPVPAPATLEVLRGVPCYASGPSFELATPTGAVLLRALSSGFGRMPALIPHITGVGAGSADPGGWPNVLRITVGSGDRGMENERVVVIETNIDDMNPQIYEYVMERLFAQGALDVFLTPVIMKKSRPGTLLTVLCSADRKDELIAVILRETTSIGVRYYEVSRVTMKREIREVRTRYGKARIKVASFGDAISRGLPEYEDCRRLAKETNVPLTEITKEVSAALPQKRNRPKKRAGGR